MHVKLDPAALTSLLLLALSIRVVDGSRRWRMGVGDGVGPEPCARIRAQANLAEHGPPTPIPTPILLFLVLLFLAEQAPGSGWFVTRIAALFLLGRVAHPFGLVRPAPNPWRAPGMPGRRLAMVSPARTPLVQVAGA